LSIVEYQNATAQIERIMQTTESNGMSEAFHSSVGALTAMATKGRSRSHSHSRSNSLADGASGSFSIPVAANGGRGGMSSVASLPSSLPDSQQPMASSLSSIQSQSQQIPPTSTSMKTRLQATSEASVSASSSPTRHSDSSTFAGNAFDDSHL
jgi:hypothetical protein